MEGRLKIDSCACVVAALIILSCIASTRSEDYKSISKRHRGHTPVVKPEKVKDPIDESIDTLQGSPLCPKDYSLFTGNNRCYRVVQHGNHDWTSARKVCQSQGGDLASITSVRLKNLITRRLKHNNKYITDFWIGLYYNQNEGEWKWVDGNPDRNVSNWGPKGPNDVDAIHKCVTIQPTGGSYWNNVPCEQKARFICEQAARDHSANFCPYDYSLYKGNDRCFRFVHEGNSDWESARNVCQSQGGDLASITSAGLNDFIRGNLEIKGNFWIGFNDIQREGDWKWADGNPDRTFSSWGRYEPSDVHAIHNCAMIQHNMCYRWNDNPCGQKSMFICERSSIKSTFTNLCRRAGGYIYPGDRSCIKLHTNARNTWSESRTICQKDGSDLVKLSNPYINNFFIDILKRTPSPLRDTNFYWLGLNDLGEEGHFRWLDEKVDAKYTYWKPNEPTNSGYKEHCVHAHVSSRNYRWNDYPCDKRISFACQKPGPPLGRLLCPAGWKMFKDQGRCFKVVDDKKAKWTTARQICQNDQGDLATIFSQEENEFVNKLHLPGEGYWIGLNFNDRWKEGRWQWLDDSSKPYFMSWQQSNPNNQDGENCVIIEPSNEFGWNDTSCARTMGFICERPPIDLSANTTLIENPCSKKGEFYYPEDQTCMYVSQGPKTWPDARKHCKSDGGDLVKVSSSSINDFMMGILSRSKGDRDLYWIGLHDRKEEDNFLWLDEATNTNFTYWKANGPTNVGHGENCVYLKVSNGYRWNGLKCEKSLPFVCQVPSPNTGPMTCPDGWSLYNAEGRCFKVVKPRNQLNWTSSRQACVSDGGDLVSITSSGVNEFLKSYLLTADNFWLGLSDRQVHGEYRWLDAAHIPAFTSFDDQIYIGDWTEECVVTLLNFKWQKIGCNFRFNYICEQPAKVVIAS